MASNDSDNDSFWRSKEFKVTIAGAVVAIIMALFVTPAGAWIQEKLVGSKNSTSTASTPEVTSAPTAERPTTPEESPTATPAANVQYLSDLPPIDGDNRIKTATLGDGQTYSHSLRSVNPFDRYTFIYAIEGNWQSFVATIGVDRGSPDESVVHFQVYLNGAPYGSGELLKRWETKEVKIPVAGKSEIKLVTSAQEGGSKVRAVWGDARFSGQ